MPHLQLTAHCKSPIIKCYGQGGGGGLGLGGQRDRGGREFENRVGAATAFEVYIGSEMGQGHRKIASLLHSPDFQFRVWNLSVQSNTETKRQTSERSLVNEAGGGGIRNAVLFLGAVLARVKASE